MEFFWGETLILTQFFRGKPYSSGVWPNSSGLNPYVGKSLGVNAILASLQG